MKKQLSGIAWLFYLTTLQAQFYIQSDSKVIFADSVLVTLRNIDFENHRDLSMEEMAERYRQADAVVFASTYEGFGMPVVEAQATGRPVITSNIEPMMWVAGAEGACFVDPFNPESMRAGIERVIQDENFRNQLTKNGLENVKRYSIGQIAGQYIQLYQKFLN